MAYDLNIGISLGAAHAGLTLRAQLVDTAGANVGGEISSGFVAVGQGHYGLLASIPDGHRGGIKIYEDGETDVLAFGAINPEEAEYADAKTSSRSSHSAADAAAAVWAAGTRTLTSVGTLVTDVWAYATRRLSDRTTGDGSVIMAAGADGDTGKTLSDQLDGIHAKTANLPASPAAVGSPMTLADIDGMTWPQLAQRLAAAIGAGGNRSVTVNEDGTRTVTIRNASAQAVLTLNVDALDQVTVEDRHLA